MMFRNARPLRRAARPDQRGSALVTVLLVMLVVFTLGASMLSLGGTVLRRSHFDVLRVQALGLAETGAERAVQIIRSQQLSDDPWRPSQGAPYEEDVDDLGWFSVVVEDYGNNQVRITSTGTAVAGDRSISRTVRVILLDDVENLNVWNNVVFGGVGQSGQSIDGNVIIRGNVHLLGEGEPLTVDWNGNGIWDDEYVIVDANGNPVLDENGDPMIHPADEFIDLNGNGIWDPPLTVTDLASNFGGTASMGNNYDGMSDELRALLPAPPRVNIDGQDKETLFAKLRVKHGRVRIQGSASVGFPPLSNPTNVKHTMDGVWVTDGWEGTPGVNGVHSDNGTNNSYPFGDAVSFPDLIQPMVVGGVAYDSMMHFYDQHALKIDPAHLETVSRGAGANRVDRQTLTLEVGQSYGPVTDDRGNSLYVDEGGTIHITGLVLIPGDLWLKDGGGAQKRTHRYQGRGTLIATGNSYLDTNVLSLNQFPTQDALGLVARHQLFVGTGGGAAQLKMTGAFYAQEKIQSAKQTEVAGAFVSSFYDMGTNVPRIYQVPDLVDNLPPGMPGDEDIWVRTMRVTSWRELN